MNHLAERKLSSRWLRRVIYRLAGGYGASRCRKRFRSDSASGMQLPPRGEALRAGTFSSAGNGASAFCNRRRRRRISG